MITTVELGEEDIKWAVALYLRSHNGVKQMEGLLPENVTLTVYETFTGHGMSEEKVSRVKATATIKV